MAGLKVLVCVVGLLALAASAAAQGRFDGNAATGQGTQWPAIKCTSDADCSTAFGSALVVCGTSGGNAGYCVEKGFKTDAAVVRTYRHDFGTRDISRDSDMLRGKLADAYELGRKDAIMGKADRVFAQRDQAVHAFASCSGDGDCNCVFTDGIFGYCLTGCCCSGTCKQGWAWGCGWGVC